MAGVEQETEGEGVVVVVVVVVFKAEVSDSGEERIYGEGQEEGRD